MATARHRVTRTAIGVAAFAFVLAAGCSSERGATAPQPTGATHLMPMPADLRASGVPGEPDAPVAGAQGRVPQFIVECPFSHALSDDPIVFPGRPGLSHVHVFFGNDSADAHSTLQTLLAGESQCDQRLDTASYWAPALFDGTTQLAPAKAVAYYRPGAGVDPATLQPYPPGLKVIAGSAAAREPQPAAVVAWTCGAGIKREVLPPTCTPDRPLRMLVTFPDCWNGADLDSADHQAHMAYSSGGRCPAGHAVPVPQLQFAVVYGFSGDPANLTLASGPIITGHADFINAWHQDKLESEIRLCLHRNVVCGVTSGGA